MQKIANKQTDENLSPREEKVLNQGNAKNLYYKFKNHMAIETKGVDLKPKKKI